MFRDDLGKALSALRTAPLLPLITIALALVGFLPQLFQEARADYTCVFRGDCPADFYARQSRNRGIQSLSTLIVLPASLFGIGWLGTERIWFLRRFSGKQLSRSEGWSFTWSFLGRYLVLGLLVGALAVPLMFFLIFRIVQSALREPERFVSGSFDPSQLMGSFLVPFLVFLVLFLILDFALTFVTPALAFSTRKVSTALRIGFRTIKEQWPRSAWYVFFPPLVVALLARWIPITLFGFWPQLTTIVVSTLLNLWFKGATAAFYLRIYPTGDDGAVHAQD